MRCYKITYSVDNTACAAWAGSETESAKLRKKAREAGVKNADITTTTIEVPTDKKGLIEFLNKEARA